ncbi:MAG: superoxide dismutase [Candidatus Micrarchaeia archaeon]
MAREVKPLPFSGELRGISKRQIDEHHDVLYSGYVKKIGLIEEKLKAADKSGANSTYSEVGELKRAEGFASNGVTLHEAYFESLGGDGGTPSGKIAEFLTQDFGSFEAWREDLKAAGMAARGWVVLAYNWIDKKFHNYSSDYHTQGIWGSSPVLVLDVYEHAYFLDYGTARLKYLNAFFDNLNWKAVNQKIDFLKISEHRG